MSLTAREALNRLCKWRLVFTGWQLGTLPIEDREGAAVRDHREVTIIMRAELNALTGLLVAKGVFTAEEYDSALESEAALLAKDYERRFPGFTATDYGIDMDKRAIETMRKHNWKP